MKAKFENIDSECLNIFFNEVMAEVENNEKGLVELSSHQLPEWFADLDEATAKKVLSAIAKEIGDDWAFHYDSEYCDITFYKKERWCIHDGVPFDKYEEAAYRQLGERIDSELLYVKAANAATTFEVLCCYLDDDDYDKKDYSFNYHRFRHALVKHFNEESWKWSEFVDYFLNDLSDDDPVLDDYDDINDFADDLFNQLRLGNVDITAFCNIQEFYNDWYNKQI